MQYITRTGNFDSMHRVMNERVKCYNIHGHTYLYELTFEFENIQKIGYAIDFKEIKRIGCQWIDDVLDHAAILNPKDLSIIELSKQLDSKYWLMSLNGNEYCNPSVENIAKEVFLTMEILFKNIEGIDISHIRLYETPKSYTDCYKLSISDLERKNFQEKNFDSISKYADDKGVVEYYDENK